MLWSSGWPSQVCEQGRCAEPSAAWGSEGLRQREEQTAAKLEGNQTMRVSRVACWVLTRQPWWSKPVDFLRNRRGTSWRRRRRGQKDGSFKNEEV